MNTVIRDPQDLPDWFDLSHYEQWQQLSPERATIGVSHHLDILATMSEYVESTNRDVEVLASFEQSLIALGRDPYLLESDRAYEMFDAISPQKCVELGIGMLDKATVPEVPTPELLEMCAELGPRIARPHYRVSQQHRLYNITLADAQLWIEQAHERKMVEDIEQNARRMADQHGWDYALVLEFLYNHVPVGDKMGTAYIAIHRGESIPVILKQVEQYLENNGFNWHENGRPSEIRKLFQYQVLAYRDLRFWADLRGVSITRRCLSRVLFPEGPYTENDLSPSKTVGTFINGLNRSRIGGLANLASTCTRWGDL